MSNIELSLAELRRKLDMLFLALIFQAKFVVRRRSQDVARMVIVSDVIRVCRIV